jgi:GDPmannose 4,6-dehydratase
MLQQEQPEDFVIATGITTSVRDLAIMAFNVVGISIDFEGENEYEIGKVAHCSNPKYQVTPGTTIIKIDPTYYRPTEVDLLIGDATKCRNKLQWKPKYTLQELVNEMVESDLKLFQKEQFLKKGGFDILNRFE